MPSLREATEDDAAALAAIYEPFCTATPVSFEIEAPSSAEMRLRIEKVLPAYPWLVCEAGGEIAGYAYASRHHERAAYRWAANVGIYLHNHHHRRGIGRALYTALLSLLDAQGYYTAYAGITLPNDASVGLHRAMGFETIGVYHGAGYKLGRWHDVAWLEKQLQPQRGEPDEPTPAAQLRDTPAWAAAIARGQRLLQK